MIEFNQDIQKLINSQARKYYYGFKLIKDMELEDFIQECYLTIFRKQDQYNREYAISTFIDLMCKHIGSYHYRKINNGKSINYERKEHNIHSVCPNGNGQTKFELIADKNTSFDQMENKILLESITKHMSELEIGIISMMANGYSRQSIVEKYGLKNRRQLDWIKEKCLNRLKREGII